MYLLNATALVTSASDLTLASECEFGFLRVLDLRLGWNTDPLPEDDAMWKRAASLGGVHESRLLERYLDEYGDAVVRFPDERPHGVETLRERAAVTRDALLAGAPVVYQGVFFDESDPALPFIGYADFLVRQPDGRYRVVDSKLARHVRVTALLQLAAYHEQLQKIGIPVDDTVELILGNDESEAALVSDIAPVFRRRRARMHEIIAEHRAEGETVNWLDERYARDGRCKYCTEPAKAADDLFTVAGLRAAQRTKLIAAGIRTLTDLAETDQRPEGLGIPVTTFSKLHLQAKLQHAVDPNDPSVPPVVVVNPLPIASLPAPNPGDLFFDFEGDPMYSEPGIGGVPRWGLDYLFGWVDAEGQFDCLWAHSQADEKLAMRAFLDFVAERRQRHPGMHIYHYASYEKTHLLSIAARHGEGEAEVDQLLREGVLVDLYPIVMGSLRIGVPSYSIKKLEPLYMGEQERAGVANAADSVEEYVRSCVAAASGDLALAAEIRAEIAQYNEYDCVSTLKLRDWLRALPEVQDLAADAAEPRFEGQSFEPSELDIELQRLASRADESGDDATATAYYLAAAAIDYHRRENKSFWWEHHARLEQLDDDHWNDARGVFAVESARVARDWHMEDRQRTERRHLHLRGKWAPGSGAPRPGGDVFLVYGDPLPYLPQGHNPSVRLARNATFLDPAEDEHGILVVETRPDEVAAWEETPTHVTPGPPPRADNIVAAIEAWGKTVIEAAPDWPSDAMSELLLRRAPGETLRLEFMQSSDDAVRAVIASLLARDSGYLAVQGPPGTGKTFLAAHVIRELIEKHHWQIGVTAQSHKVVENVLDAVVLDAQVDPELVAKAAPSEHGAGYYDESPFTELRSNGHLTYADAHISTGYVIGGTAWDLTNRNRVLAGQLDLLVIDEAGQFALANTIGVAMSAKRILLLGDPQQLPQVSQGIHPAPVDGSALGHVIGGLAVLPENYGYFLEESRRMDAAVAQPVSRLSYDGQLRSHASTRGRMLAGVTPGLHPVPVAHANNSTFSSEEADEVVGLVRQHLGAMWTAEAGATSKPLDQFDIIVVTPYNAQVELLRQRLDQAGFQAVQVGTVDKFQGREAVISIVSLAASSAADVPRGLDFLLSRNRLNVSISRAKWAAYLVYSPALLDSLPNTADGVATLSRFINLTEDA